MWKRNARGSLKEQSGEYDAWRQTVPARAELFHRRLDALAADVARLLERWWPREEELRLIEQRHKRLRQVAPGLPRLCEDAEALATKLAALRPGEGLLAAELAAWLGPRHEQWASQLESVGRHVERPTVLGHEEGLLATWREELQRAVEVTDTLRDAQALLTRLGEERTAEAFRQTLPDLGDRLRDGPDDTWLAELRQALVPLKEADEKRQNPPRVIQDVFHMLSDLRLWARYFDREQEVARVEERHRNLALDWSERDPEELEELRREVEETRLRFFDQAREERQGRLRRLEEEMEDFFAVCGREGDLEEHLEELRQKHRKVIKPQDHREWIKTFDRIYNTFFKGIAENQQASLGQRLDELHANLTAGLAEIRRQPLSDAVRQDVARLEYEAGRLQGLQQIEDVLRGLRQSQDLEHDLRELVLRSRQESEELAARQAELLARHGELRRAAAALRTDVPAFAIEEPDVRLETLDEGDRTLEEARQDALDLEERLAAEERRFAAEGLACAAGLEEEIGRKLETLRRAERPVERPVGRPLDEGSAPAEVAACLAAAAAFHRTLDGHLVDALPELEEQRREQWEALQAVSLEGLGPVDRADVEQIQELFAEDLEAAYPKPGERLARLLDLLAQGETLFHQLRQEEIEVRQQHRSLRERFRAFKDAHLRRYAPELTDRLEGLIHGVPDLPRRWRDARQQLRGVEVLLGRLERYARRLAARELARDLEALKKLTQNGADERTREEAADLVAEVATLGGLRLPSALLRMKVRRAARGHHGGVDT